MIRQIHGIFLLISTLLTGQCYATVSDSAADVGRYGLPLSALMVSIIQHDGVGVQQFARSFAVSIAATALLKQHVNERRPNGASTRSFPSGHAVWAFSPASYLHARYGLTTAAPAYFFASSVAISRVVHRHHHWHDVISGALLASLASYSFTNNYQGDNLSFSLSVQNNNDQRGVSLHLQWIPD